MGRMAEKKQTKEDDINTHVVLVMGFVQKGDKFLITKRHFDDPQAGGTWAIPGGKVDPGVEVDIIQHTLKEEMMEEVGIEIEDDIALIANDTFVRVSGHHVVALTFLCRWKSGKAQPLEDQEEVKWVTLENLQKMEKMPKYMKRRIDCLVKYLSKK